ncbi:MAG: PTS sugar transporter subunit IIA [Treponema sp.]|nr:PTS sugar transporter subunit IIA [Candidatus Treponema caballi]
MGEKSIIDSLIRKGGVVIDAPGKTLPEVYRNVLKDQVFPEGLTSNSVYKELIQREKMMGTGVGNGVAIPHPRYPLIKTDEDQRIIVVYLKNPIAISSPDMRPVSTLFITLTSSSKNHLQVLSDLAFLIQKAPFREALEKHSNEEALLKTIHDILEKNKETN